MAVVVILHALSAVKITHATYKVDHVWIVKMDILVFTVTCRVPPTVKITHVKY